MLKPGTKKSKKIEKLQTGVNRKEEMMIDEGTELSGLSYGLAFQV